MAHPTAHIELADQAWCNLATLRREYDDDLDDYRVVGVTCDQPLYLTSSASCALGVEEFCTEPEFPADVRGWQIECGGGHVLLASHDRHEDEEYPPLPTIDDLRALVAMGHVKVNPEAEVAFAEWKASA